MNLNVGPDGNYLIDQSPVFTDFMETDQQSPNAYENRVGILVSQKHALSISIDNSFRLCSPNKTNNQLWIDHQPRIISLMHEYNTLYQEIRNVLMNTLNNPSYRETLLNCLHRLVYSSALVFRQPRSKRPRQILTMEPKQIEPKGPVKPKTIVWLLTSSLATEANNQVQVRITIFPGPSNDVAIEDCSIDLNTCTIGCQLEKYIYKQRFSSKFHTDHTSTQCRMST